jgi:hypothetical protein
MKVFVIILRVLVLIGIQLNAQEPSLPSVEEFLNSSPERAYQILNTPTGGQQIDTYVRAAVASGRTDLVMACFKNPSSWNFALSAIAELPESPQRDEWTILMLKSPSSLWPCEEIHDGSGLIPKDVMDEPFVSLVRRLLPGHPTSGEAVFTTEKRLKLAAELETALGKNRSSQNTQSFPPGDAVVEHPSATTSSPASTPQPPPQQPKAATSWLMWVGILGAMIGLLYWLFKPGNQT